MTFRSRFSASRSNFSRWLRAKEIPPADHVPEYLEPSAFKLLDEGVDQIQGREIALMSVTPQVVGSITVKDFEGYKRVRSG